MENFNHSLPGISSINHIVRNSKSFRKFNKIGSRCLPILLFLFLNRVTCNTFEKSRTEMSPILYRALKIRFAT